MSDFSDFPGMCGYFAPVRFEAEVLDCEVSGTIPADLSGAFYRMHADWFYPPCADDEASLSADGYISMFRIKGGVVDYRGRYVRTQRFEAQREARRQLFGYFRNPFTDDASVRDPENPQRRTASNTTPVVIAGKLYSTKEDARPYRIDPNSLATLGDEDFDGEWPISTFTAHPKLDRQTGETIAFGYEASGLCANDVVCCIFDDAGAIRSKFRFEVPYTSMMHDIAITPNYVIFPGSCMVTSLERLHAGRPHWGWDGTLPSWYGIMSRATGEVRWFFGEGRSIVHTANAWEEDGCVVMDLPMASGNTWPFFEDIHGGSFTMAPNTIRRLTFDLRSNGDQCREEVLFDREVTSFTRIDERFMGLRNRYIYVQYADLSKPFTQPLPEDQDRTQPVSSVGRFDLQTGEVKTCWAGPHHLLQEPTFVPRAGATGEGDGYLLATVHNIAERHAELIIIDAQAMTEMARVRLPFRNAMQVHGCWAGEDDLALI